MEAQHDDGSTLAVQVQGADRHGDGSRWSVRVTVNVGRTLRLGVTGGGGGGGGAAAVELHASK